LPNVDINTAATTLVALATAAPRVVYRIDVHKVSSLAQARCAS